MKKNIGYINILSLILWTSFDLRHLNVSNVNVGSPKLIASITGLSLLEDK